MKLKDAIKDLRKGDFINIYFMDDIVDENLDYPLMKLEDLTTHYKSAILDCVVVDMEVHTDNFTDIYLLGTSKDLTK